MASKVLERAKAYQEIKIAICERLKNKRPENNRLPSISELALELGRGKINTHRAIQELVKDGILVSRPKLGTYISDIDNIKVRLDELIRNDGNQEMDKPLTGKKIQIVMSKSSSAYKFICMELEAFFSVLSDSGANVERRIISDNDWDPFSQYSQVDGIVVINPGTMVNLKCASPFQVLMVIDTTQCKIVNQLDRFDCVCGDDIQGSLLAGQFLKRMGWEDVCFIGAENQSDPSGYEATSFIRMNGFAIGLGHPIKPEHQLRIQGYWASAAAKAIPQWYNLHPRPSAIFAASDDIAFAFINGAYALGLTPGRDYQIIGFDGQQMDPDPEIGWITTIRLPWKEMGSLAAKMLVERMQNPQITPRRVCLSCSLVEGNTVNSHSKPG